MSKRKSISKFAVAVIVVALGILAGSPAAQAAVIAEYNFNDSVDGTPDVMDLAADNVPGGVTAGSFGIGSGLLLADDAVKNTNNGAGLQTWISLGTSGPVLEHSINGTDLLIMGPVASANNATSAIAQDDFVQFSITPDAGYEISFTNFTVDLLWRSNGALKALTLRSSLTGDTNLGTASYYDLNTMNVLVPVDFDLSGFSALQDVSGPVTFTLSVYNGGDSNQNKFLFSDNYQMHGDVIPEPATMSLLAVGGLACLLKRKQKA